MEKIGINRYSYLVLIALAGIAYSIDAACSKQVNGPTCYRSDMPALHEAAYKGQNDVVGQLLAAGADINAKDLSGETALHCAACAGRITQ